MLATAKIDGLGLSRFKLHGTEIAALVAAIAKRLIGAETAGTPEVALACFHLHRVRTLLGNYRIGHCNISLLATVLFR
jgi:hypothetical protein